MVLESVRALSSCETRDARGVDVLAYLCVLNCREAMSACTRLICSVTDGLFGLLAPPLRRDIRHSDLCPSRLWIRRRIAANTVAEQPDRTLTLPHLLFYSKALKFIGDIVYFSALERWNGTTALDRDDQLIVKTRACTDSWARRSL